MHDFGLVPDGLIDETERRIQSLVECLQDAPAEDDMQHAVDDLVLDHCGTSKHWSNVNNQGLRAQVEAPVEALGIDAAEELLNETLSFLAED